MKLPNTFDTTPFVLSKLKTRQRAFVQYLYDAGHDTVGDIVFKRNYLKSIANINGIAWAPAWIVKDVSRVTERGMYAVPELDELIALAVANDTPVVEDDDIDASVVQMPASVHDDLDKTIEVSDDMVAITTS